MAPRPAHSPTQHAAKDTRARPFAGRPYLLGSIHPATHEIRELAGTLGMELIAEVFQPRDRPHPGAFFGKGKLEALRSWVSELKAGIRPADWVWVHDHWEPTDEWHDEEERTAWAGTAWATPPPSAAHGGTSHREDLDSTGSTDGPPSGDAPEAALRQVASLGKADLLLVLNEDVRPAVLFNLEERLGIEVWDRTRLILEIFTQHAHVKEARLQVELAKLQYEIPLIHEAVHRQRAGERPGFMSGGDYEVADYEDFIKRRMRSVKDELARIRDERKVRRKVRRERFYLVSLAGYTNAGKSSLLNALTGAGKLSEGTMFSTLETTTRRLVNPRRAASSERVQNQYERPVLLTDTVGFIQALPSWLLEAFHSTLEEIGVSDVVLLVADVSDPVDVLLEKVRVCREELAYLDVTCPVVLVLNKTDLLPARAVAMKRERLLEAGFSRATMIAEVSSVNGQGLTALLGRLDAALPKLISYECRVPVHGDAQRFLSLIYTWGEVESIDYGTVTVARGHADPIFWKDLQSEAVRIGAQVSRTSR